MAGTINLGSVIIGLVFTLSIISGLSFSMLNFAEVYEFSVGTASLDAMEEYNSVNNLTSSIATNIQETGILDESSNSKIISVGWNSLKLVSSTPVIISSYANNLKPILKTYVGGIAKNKAINMLPEININKINKNIKKAINPMLFFSLMFVNLLFKSTS